MHTHIKTICLFSIVITLLSGCGTLRQLTETGLSYKNSRLELIKLTTIPSEDQWTE